MSPVRNFMISSKFTLKLVIILVGETDKIIIRFLTG